MARKYQQGIYTPRNPEKYVGNVNNIFYRSSWELKFMVYCDNTASILKWNSEECMIPYISPVDNLFHRYFVDFIIEYKTKDTIIKRAAVEIKPKAQTEMPKPPKRMNEGYLNSVKTYAVNKAKWAAAEKWCADKGMQFLVLDEFALGIKKENNVAVR